MIKNNNRNIRRHCKQKINNKKKNIGKYTYGAVNVHKDGYVTNFWKHSRQKRYLKKLCNRSIRRSDDIFNGGQYKKKCEYWWELF